MTRILADALVQAQGTRGSNTQPLAFGPDQSIIDLNKLVWGPPEAEGVPPGPEMAVLRGDGQAAGFEVAVRLPAHDTFPNHRHTSDEHDVWLQGHLTYIAADGTATPLSGQPYISLPGGVPHARACGAEPCVFYVRSPQPFDAHAHPMPPLKKYTRGPREQDACPLYVVDTRADGRGRDRLALTESDEDPGCPDEGCAPRRFGS